MKTIAAISVLGALLLLAPFQSAQAAKPDASKVITIVALGDSLTEGYGLSRKQAYPALIAERMRSAGSLHRLSGLLSSEIRLSWRKRSLPASGRSNHAMQRTADLGSR